MKIELIIEQQAEMNHEVLKHLKDIDTGKSSAIPDIASIICAYYTD